MFSISKEFSFEAAHRLDGLPPEHLCSRLHGHSYSVILTLEGEYLNDVGFLRDYRELDEVKKWIDKTLDHKCLNDVFSFNPTAENLAKQIFIYFSPVIPELSQITIKETAKTTATYSALKNLPKDALSLAGRAFSSLKI